MNTNAHTKIVDTREYRDESRKVARPERRSLSEERIGECLGMVEIALRADSPEEAVAAVQRAFRPEEKEIDLDSPVAVLGLDTRTTNALEGVGLDTLAKVQAFDFERLRMIPNFAAIMQRRVIVAMIDAGFTLKGLDGWIVARAMQLGAEMSTTKTCYMLTWGFECDENGKPKEDEEGKPVQIKYPAYIDHAEQLALDEHTRRRLWAAIHNTPAPETASNIPQTSGGCADPGFRRHREAG